MHIEATNIFIDARFDDEYARHPLVLADVGARGGLKLNWASARRHLRVIGFEPDAREYRRLRESAGTGDESALVFPAALHNRPGPVRLNVARDPGLSSIFEPDREFIDAFPEAERFDTTDVQEIDADTLDNLLRARGITDIDFVKADTQGSELFVLEGAAGALADSAVGIEVEVEFTPIYKAQPLFADVDAFVRRLGYLLFDLRPCYWKRAAGRDSGGAHGQIIWADALYLKSVSALEGMLARLPADERRSKLLKAISVSLLYGYYDYALEIAGHAGAVLSTDERALVEQRLREGGSRHDPLPAFPGRRRLAGALRRLWRICRMRNEGWSVSDPGIGNLD